MKALASAVLAFATDTLSKARRTGSLALILKVACRSIKRNLEADVTTVVQRQRDLEQSLTWEVH